MTRIRPIPKERAAVVLRNLYDAAENQFGTVPNLFKTLAHRPELLLTFANFYRELWTGGVVEVKIKELAAARAAAINGTPYSITHHGAAGERAGLSAPQRAAVQRDDWQASGLFDEREQAVIRLAEKLTRAPASITDEDIEKLRKWFGEAHLVELALLIATVNLTDRVSQGFAVDVD